MGGFQNRASNSPSTCMHDTANDLQLLCSFVSLTELYIVLTPFLLLVLVNLLWQINSFGRLQNNQTAYNSMQISNLIPTLFWWIHPVSSFVCFFFLVLQRKLQRLPRRSYHPVRRQGTVNVRATCISYSKPIAMFFCPAGFFGGRGVIICRCQTFLCPFW